MNGICSPSCLVTGVEPSSYSKHSINYIIVPQYIKMYLTEIIFYMTRLNTLNYRRTESNAMLCARLYKALEWPKPYGITVVSVCELHITTEYSAVPSTVLSIFIYTIQAV
jgi:hypothetical protein